LACSVFTPLAQVSRVAHSTCCSHAAPTIPVDRQTWSIASAWRLGFPRFPDGSASTSPLSEPARASLALRPAYSLDLLSGAFFFGASSQGVASLPRPMASEVNRQFLGRDFHPRVRVHPHGAPESAGFRSRRERSPGPLRRLESLSVRGVTSSDEPRSRGSLARVSGRSLPGKATVRRRLQSQ